MCRRNHLPNNCNLLVQQLAQIGKKRYNHIRWIGKSLTRLKKHEGSI